MELAAPAPLSISRCLSVGGVNPARGLGRRTGSRPIHFRRAARAKGCAPDTLRDPAARGSLPVSLPSRDDTHGPDGRTHLRSRSSHAADGRRHNGTTWPVAASGTHARAMRVPATRGVFLVGVQRAWKTDDRRSSRLIGLSARVYAREHASAAVCSVVAVVVLVVDSCSSGPTRYRARRPNVVTSPHTCCVTETRARTWSAAYERTARRHRRRHLNQR
jgi:hypothetical protein